MLLGFFSFFQKKLLFTLKVVKCSAYDAIGRVCILGLPTAKLCVPPFPSEKNLSRINHTKHSGNRHFFIVAFRVTKTVALFS